MAINLGVASLEAILDTIVPVGTVIAFAGTSVPDGWLLCDGSAISRSTYARLYNAVGNAHGYGDNSTTFNVPDYRGRFLRGVAGASTNDPDKLTRTAAATGGATGNAVGSVQTGQNSSHSHTTNTTAYNVNAAIGGVYFRNVNKLSAGMDEAVGNIAYYTTNTNAINTSGGSETRPLNANVNYLIRI